MREPSSTVSDLLSSAQGAPSLDNGFLKILFSRTVNPIHFAEAVIHITILNLKTKACKSSDGFAHIEVVGELHTWFSRNIGQGRYQFFDVLTIIILKMKLLARVSIYHAGTSYVFCLSRGIRPNCQNVSRLSICIIHFFNFYIQFCYIWFFFVLTDGTLQNISFSEDPAAIIDDDNLMKESHTILFPTIGKDV